MWEPSSPLLCQPGQRCGISCTHPTLPELRGTAHHQRRCLHRLHLSQVTGSVQRPAVVPLVECGIGVWSRRGDSQSPLHHPRRRCELCPAPHIQREGPSPTWSHVAHLDLFPGGFLVYKHGRAHQGQSLQPGAAEELLPALAGGARAQLQLCDPRTPQDLRCQPQEAI